MNQREIVVEPSAEGRPGRRHRISSLAVILAGLLTTLLVYLFQGPLLGDLNNYPLTLFLWIFGVMLACAFSVVRHADAVARHLGEPYGTLVLTISASPTARSCSPSR